MKFTRFEDIQAWQEARQLVSMVYAATNRSKDLSADLRFSSQLSSAAVSVMSNIAEGFARETDKEFIRGLWISKGSAAEVQSLTYAAHDLGYLTEREREQIYSQAEKISRMLSGLITYLRSSQ